MAVELATYRGEAMCGELREVGEIAADLLQQPGLSAMTDRVRKLATQVLESKQSQRDKALWLADILRAVCATRWGKGADVQQVWAATSHLWWALITSTTNEQVLASVIEAVEHLAETKQQQGEGDHAAVVGHCVRFIAENYHNDITLEDIAATVHLSSSHVSRLMREHLGMSFVYLLTRTRIEQAIRLMTDSGAPLYWVARQVGYKSPTYFSRVFRRTTGCSPSDYRAQLDRALRG